MEETFYESKQNISSMTKWICPLSADSVIFRKDQHIFHYKKVQSGPKIQSGPSTPQQMFELCFLF